MDQHADTVPGFTMQSEAFYLKFVTGLQCGVSSKLLEYETDWYEVMEILLSRLQDEPEKKELFETIASRDLEYWARIQPGGDTLNLKIRVSLEEKRYFLPPSGSRKTLRLIFNDRFSTQVIFHARKKMLLKSLRDLAAIAVADHFDNGKLISKLDTEVPRSVIPDVMRAFSNCWTPRFFRTKIVACPPWCACKTWRKPLPLLEAKMKKSTRRQLYKRVAGKPVARKAQQKQATKKIESKSNKKLASKTGKKLDGKKSNKSSKKAPKESKIKSSISKSAASISTSKADIKKKKSTQKNAKTDMKVKKIQSTPKPSTPKAINAPKSKSTATPKNQNPASKPKKLKKSIVKKNVDNVKVLKDKVKLMKNKLKSLMENVVVKDKSGLDIKGKLNVKKRKTEGPKRQETPKRRSSRNVESNVIGNPKKKQKMESKSSKVSKEGIFSPRPTRRSVVQEPSSQVSKSSDTKKLKSSEPKFTKYLKQKNSVKSSPKSMSKSKKSSQSRSKCIEPRIPKMHSLKRTLRSQFQEAPTSKRRRQG